MSGIRDGAVTDPRERLIQFKTNMDVVMSLLDRDGLGDWVADPANPNRLFLTTTPGVSTTLAPMRDARPKVSPRSSAMVVSANSRRRSVNGASSAVLFS